MVMLDELVFISCFDIASLFETATSPQLSGVVHISHVLPLLDINMV